MAFVSLSEHPDPTLPDGVFDLRGWPVHTLVDARDVGSVHDVLLDAEDCPRYLALALRRPSRSILLPIGQARADAERRRVWLPGLSADALDAVPEAAAAPTREQEAELIAAYRRAQAGDDGAWPRAYAGAIEQAQGSRAETDAAPPLAPLGSLDHYVVAAGDPDPRGWPVLCGDGVTIAHVAELLVDTHAHKVRHLVCAVDEAALGLDRQLRHVLVPIGFARLAEREHLVIVDMLTVDDVAEMPVYTGDAVGRELEREVLERLGADGGQRFYHHPRFDYRACFGRTAGG